MNLQRQNIPVIGFDGLLRDIGDHAGIQPGLQLRQPVRQHGLLFDEAGNPVRRLQGNLASVIPVNLVSVEFCRIMAGGDHDAGAAAQMAHREAQHGRGLQLRIEIHPDAHFRQGGGRQLHKVPAVDPAVAAQRGGGLSVGLLQIAAQPPGSPQHGEKVHPVGTGSQHAPEPAGTEGQIPVEGVVFRFLIHGAQVLQKLPGHGRAGRPGFILLLNGHGLKPPHKKMHPQVPLTRRAGDV